MNSPVVLVERRPPLLLISINRPKVRNAVNADTAVALSRAFREFEQDDDLYVAVLSGVGKHFCAGADLKAVATGKGVNHISAEGDGPMGPTRMQLSKPVIAAISGYCVAGGLELAAWCDLRVADETSVFGVFCRRFGVPLIDGGTVRLPRLIGMSHALDMILTGRSVDAQEALQIGLANRVVAIGDAMQTATQLALQLATLPQQCLRGDRSSAYQQWELSEQDAIANEFCHGLATLQSGETLSGANQFLNRNGRHGGPTE